MFNTVYNENVPQKWWIKNFLKKGGGSTNWIPITKTWGEQKLILMIMLPFWLFICMFSLSVEAAVDLGVLAYYFPPPPLMKIYMQIQIQITLLPIKETQTQGSCVLSIWIHPLPHQKTTCLLVEYFHLYVLKSFLYQHLLIMLTNVFNRDSLSMGLKPIKYFNGS